MNLIWHLNNLPVLPAARPIRVLILVYSHSAKVESYQVAKSANNVNIGSIQELECFL